MEQLPKRSFDSSYPVPKHYSNLVLGTGTNNYCSQTKNSYNIPNKKKMSLTAGKQCLNNN